MRIRRYSHSTVDPAAKNVRAEHESLEHYLRAVLSEEELQRVFLPSFSQWRISTSVVAEVAATLHSMDVQPTIGLWADTTPLRDVGWSTSGVVARLFLSPARDHRVRRGLEKFGLPREAFVDPPLRPWRPVGDLPHVERLNRSAIRELTYRGAPAGRAILQVHPDRDTPITDEHLWPEKWVEACLRSFAYAFDQTLQVIDERQCTALGVFNGRFLHDAAAAAAGRHRGIPVLSYDYGGNDTDFDLTIDDTHDWSALQSRMQSLYASWPDPDRDHIGARWFEDRRAHVDPRNALFVESQHPGRGIERPTGSRLVVYFSSSGDEISELDLDWSEYFYGQAEALVALADACRMRADVTLLVRTHPHKRMKPQRDVKEWHAVVDAAQPDIHLDEFSDVDSYTLMDQADVVVTYGSTTGVEAAYAGRPVVVMGPSAYDELGCATRVRSGAELAESLERAREGSRSGALAYGLMMRRRGFSFRFLQQDLGGEPRLAGVELRDAAPIVLKVSDVTAKRQANSLQTE